MGVGENGAGGASRGAVMGTFDGCFWGGKGIGGGGIWAQVWGGEIVLFGCEFFCLDLCFWVF
jgi:hypothetical protein